MNPLQLGGDAEAGVALPMKWHYILRGSDVAVYSTHTSCCLCHPREQIERLIISRIALSRLQ